MGNYYFKIRLLIKKIGKKYFRGIVAKKIILLIVVFVLFFSLILHQKSAQFKKVLTYNNSLFQKVQIYLFDLKWNSEINLVGGRQAYENFRIAYKNENMTKQHDMDHVFGLLLYNKYGLDGINYCGESFGYGCYHSLVGNTITKNGISVTKDLIRHCQSLKDILYISSCLHGMGHGILAYYGDNILSLQQGLQICNRFTDLVDLVTCTSGIFMEYNFQNMHGYQSSLRKFDNTQPNYPCNAIQSEFRPGCYFQQAFWWLKSIPGSNVKKVTEIDKLCSSLSASQEYEQCYRGLAIHLGFHNGWDAEEAKSLCLQLVLPQNSTRCVIQAASVFAHTAKLKKEAKQMCGNLSKKDYSICVKAVDSNLANYI